MYDQNTNANDFSWIALLALLGIGLGITFVCYLSNPKLVMQG